MECSAVSASPPLGAGPGPLFERRENFMKKSIALLMTFLFLAVVSGPALADEAKPTTTPAAKSMKHKKMAHKAGKKSGKKTQKKVKAETTPTAK